MNGSVAELDTTVDRDSSGRLLPPTGEFGGGKIGVSIVTAVV
jgi:hypothetical protein